LSSKFLWRPRLVRAVSGGGPKSCWMRLWDIDVAVLETSWFVGKRLVGEGGPRSCSMRLWDVHRTVPRHFYHSFLVGKIVRRSLNRVSRNVAGLKPIQNPLAAESLLPPARFNLLQAVSMFKIVGSLS
jgi:hypothetical protein